VFNQREDDTLEYDSDWELAPQIVETIGTGMAPDQSEELDAFVSLEARIEDLLVLRETIVDTHGMCQGFALEAQRLLPEFDRKAPLGFYTVAPTATRFTIALEELGAGIWTLIAAGIAAVIAALVKFFKWLGKGDETKAAERMKDAAGTLKEAQDLLKECETLVAEGNKSIENKYLFIKHKPQKEHYSLDSLVKTLFMDSPHEQRVAAFLQTRDPFFHDLVNKGPYSAELGKLAGFFNGLQIVLRQRVNALQQVSKLDLIKDDASSGTANLRVLETLAEPTRVHYNGKEMTLQDVKTIIQDATHHVHEEKPEGNLSFDQLFSTMNEALSASDAVKSLEEVGHLTPLLESMKDELLALEKKAGQYSTDGKKGQQSTLVGTGLRHAIFTLGVDIANLTSLAAEVAQYQQRLLHLAANAASFSEAVATKLGNEVKDQSGAELEIWHGIAKDLARKRVALQQLYRS
jgi:hypothetical protein